MVDPSVKRAVKGVKILQYWVHAVKQNEIELRHLATDPALHNTFPIVLSTKGPRIHDISLLPQQNLKPG